MRVVVAGAGIAGLTAAAGFARDGHDVTILERRLDTTSGTAITLWPNALAALDAIDVGVDVRAASERVSGGAMRWCDGSWIRRPDRDAVLQALGEPLSVLRRVDLTEVLTRATAGATRLRSGVAAVSARTERGRAIVGIADGEDLDADLVVVADGIGSRLIHGFNPGLAARYTGASAWRGIAETRIDPELAGQVLGPGVEFGAVPLPNGRTYWFASRRLPEGTIFDNEHAEVSRLGEGWPTPIGEVIAATPPESLMRTDLYDRSTARRWYDGRVVALGDAVHPMRPHLGQGGCQAIEDAAVLTGALRGGVPVGSALAVYQRIRRPRVRRVVMESRAVGRAVSARPVRLSGAAIRASRALPDALMLRHLASIAGSEAFARQWRLLVRQHRGGMAHQMHGPAAVPLRPVQTWCPRQDSNLRPRD
ncbi:FAD-dependent monooxygenase [Gordonia sp. (in: high G+C Gram-positive bacteria)]|uniref:FAD-dependent monooxygenase n=1 Tax=Gordonia sp. (in: high G+C Gram-positive bacteria) TaxID=84139 RepID=UPI00169D9C76|nr:FAD-dependent monooxygenase [Gordonia sp. (in: high G+C Gram-positive bacteria)]NLG45834.1 NAD(P)-binding protein [Gordonia sp. (in: high G+C Gram-positive bacteria)]